MCRDSDIYFLVRREENSNAMVLVKYDEFKYYFVDLENKPNVDDLKEMAHDFFSRHNLYYKPEKLIPRDIKDPAKHTNQKVNSIKLQERFNYWKVVPGLRLPVSVSGSLNKKTRGMRKRTSPFNQGRPEDSPTSKKKKPGKTISKTKTNNVNEDKDSLSPSTKEKNERAG